MIMLKNYRLKKEERKNEKDCFCWVDRRPNSWL